jgi:flagellin
MAASVINTNLMSLNSQRNLNKNSLSLATSLERLSSGLRVNSARDDAAGLAVGMTLQSDIRSLSVQMRNEADKISGAQNLDAGLSVATDILQRMNELAVQAQGTNGQAQVANINKEYTALNSELGNISGATAPTVTSLTATNGASAAAAIATALSTTAGTRADHGATMAVAEFTIQRYEASREAKSAERSRIMDTDFAMETANLARGQILMQAGTAMVAQANAIPQNVLSLLR